VMCLCRPCCVSVPGLDSFAALSVMGHLQHVAQATHQTVIATIHQPRSAIWEMFDMVRPGSSTQQQSLADCKGQLCVGRLSLMSGAMNTVHSVSDTDAAVSQEQAAPRSIAYSFSILTCLVLQGVQQLQIQ
jgi:ABC-type multidrug transport system ATPase subunit